MGAEYVNRKDKRYFLYEGKTKAGNPKYFCSKKPSSSGVALDAMPAGYEWRENPLNGLVSVRKVRPTRIADFEREMLCTAIRNQAGLTTFIVDVTEDSLVAYIPDRNPDEVGQVFERMGFNRGVMSIREWMVKHSQYLPMMRFTLNNEDERLFSVERWCFLGSIDGWRKLAGWAPLETLINKYAKHLGDESFFELI